MNRSAINRIVAATCLTGHTVQLTFDDGYVGRVDLAPALWGPVFEPLLDAEYFQRFRLEDDTIRWPNDADFCPNVLRYWCESGSVCAQEDTDNHLAVGTKRNY
jgi:hypothetical protein